MPHVDHRAFLPDCDLEHVVNRAFRQNVSNQLSMESILHNFIQSPCNNSAIHDPVKQKDGANLSIRSPDEYLVAARPLHRPPLPSHSLLRAPGQVPLGRAAGEGERAGRDRQGLAQVAHAGR